MDKLIAAFNIRLEEKQSRKRTLESNISNLESRYKEAYKEAQEELISYAFLAEECEHLKMLWQQAMVCDGGPIADAAEYQARQSYEEAAFNLKKAEDKKKTAEEKLRSIEDSLSSQKEEYNTLSKELDNLLNLPEEKKAEAYYNCLLEDMQAAKSQEDYAALTKKFSDVSEYRDCAALADKCMELNYCKLVEKMQAAVAELNEDEPYLPWLDLLAEDFYAIGEYKDCAALADKCMELNYCKLVEEMQVAVSNEDYAYLKTVAYGFSSMSDYKDCAELSDFCHHYYYCLHEKAERPSYLKTLKDEKKSLGFFKFKDKKAVQAKINVVENEIVLIQSRIDAAKEKARKDISSAENRIKDIDTELTNPR